MAVERTDLERWLREMDAADLELIDIVASTLRPTLYPDLGHYVTGRRVIDPITGNRVGQVALVMRGDGRLIVKRKPEIDASPMCQRALLYAVKSAAGQHTRWRRAKRFGRGGSSAVRELARLADFEMVRPLFGEGWPSVGDRLA